jgi:hypothetical protein
MSILSVLADQEYRVGAYVANSMDCDAYQGDGNEAISIYPNFAEEFLVKANIINRI